MSLAAITWAFDQHDTTPTQRLVLLCLADYANQDDEAWPSAKKVAERTGLSPASVYRTLSDLKRGGYVEQGSEDRRDILTLRIGFSQGEKDSHSETPYIDRTPKNPQEPKGAEGEVWTHYLSAFNPRRKEPDEGQRKIIRDALTVASVEECRRCIDACAASDFHQQRGDGQKAGRKHNRIGDILKPKRASQYGGGYTQRERIDFWLDRAAESGGLTEEERDRIREEWVEARNRGLTDDPKPDYTKKSYLNNEREDQ